MYSTVTNFLPNIFWKMMLKFKWFIMDSSVLTIFSLNFPPEKNLSSSLPLNHLRRNHSRSLIHTNRSALLPLGISSSIISIRLTFFAVEPVLLPQSQPNWTGSIFRTFLLRPWPTLFGFKHTFFSKAYCYFFFRFLRGAHPSPESFKTSTPSAQQFSPGLLRAKGSFNETLFSAARPL